MRSVETTVCPHDCPSTCALEVEIEDGRLAGVRGGRRNPYTAGVVCAKVARYAERFHHAERLAHPLRRRGAKGDGDFVRIGWNEALDEVAEAFLKAEQRHGAEAVWPYWYAGTMGLVNRDGINRLTHAKGYSRFKSTICVELSNVGWKAGYGKRWGVPAEEAGAHANLIVVWGCNPVSTHVNLMTHAARARKRGAPLVVVDPYLSGTAKAADLHLPVRPGTDGALACAAMCAILEMGLEDGDYLARFTDWDEGVEAHLRSRTPEWAAPITGLDPGLIRRFARMWGEAKPAWMRLGFGFTRSRNGAQQMHAASCLPILTGAWQIDGGGALYNQGDFYRWDKTLIEGEDVIDPAVRELDQSRIGPVLTGDRRDLGDGPPVTALLVQSTNPMCVAPELGKVAAGFARDDLFVAVHEQFMTETAKMADIVLPATQFLEHDDVYQASGHSFVQVGRRLFPPYAEARSNHEVVCGLAKRLGAEHPGFSMSERELADDLLRRSGRPGFEEVAASGGHDVMPDADTAHYRNGFPTTTGRFRFRPDWRSFGRDGGRMAPLPDHLAVTDEATAERPYRLVAAPARQFLNTTFTETAGSRQREGEPTALLHPDALARLGVADGGRVRIGNERGAVELPAKAAEGQHPFTVVVESIWPNRHWRRGLGLNQLLSAESSPPNGGAAVHDTSVWVERA
ncbi:MAG: molybdopterin-dependent oxidoreductase [Geminicoccaceae bacterium]|nr:molybdopterin-dependent oxidoreductase [Geminicoccaceae bacterium]